MEQQTGSKLGKEHIKAVYCYLLIYLIHRVHHVKCWLGEAQAIIKIARRNINNLRHVDDTILMVESEEEINSLLIKLKESEKAGLKLNIQKAMIMASSHHFLANRWENNTNSDRFYFLGL